MVRVRGAAAEVACAAEGPPIYSLLGGSDDEGYLPARMKPIVPSAMVVLAATPWSGPDGSRLRGDGVAPDPLRLERARLGVCGQSGGLGYRIVYEPWDNGERGRVDASSWGRFTDAQLGWSPVRWLVIAAGMGKVPLLRGREQPIGALALPLLPLATTALEPDRRLGLTLDADLGVLRAAGGAYVDARRFDLDAGSAWGVLLAARLEATPIGPVGRRNGSAAGPWTGRARFTVGVGGAYRRTVAGIEGFLVGGDLAVARGRFFLAVEVAYADRWPLERATADPGRVARRVGGWLESVVMLWRPYLSAAARVEYLDEDLRATTSVGRYVALGTGLTGALPGGMVQMQLMYTHKFHLAFTGGAVKYDGALRDEVLIITLNFAR